VYQGAAAQLLELLADHTVEACRHTFGFADAGIAVLPLLLLQLRGRLEGKTPDPAQNSVG
jgi:hypothetical protein